MMMDNIWQEMASYISAPQLTYYCQADWHI